MRRLLGKSTLLKLVVLLFLARVAYKGFLRTPEIATRVSPAAFYSSLVEGAKDASIMKERHLDFINATLFALSLREHDEETNPLSLVTRETLELAKEREAARWYREGVNYERSKELVARLERLAGTNAPEPLGCQYQRPAGEGGK